MVVYVDNSATTRVRPEVVDAMLPYLANNYGNPSSIHSLGKAAEKAVHKARAQVASLLNCDDEDVHFSSGGTASNNLAILGRARFVTANDGGRHLITTQIEHPSSLGPAQYLESQGWKVSYLPVGKNGMVSISDLENAITSDTSIISIVWANNEIGTIQPIKLAAQLAKTRGIFFHADAVQMPGKVKIDLKDSPISSLSLSGHKFYAPKGIGVLFLRKTENLMPISFGGGQQKGLLPGTESVANIVGIGEAAALAHQELKENSKHLADLQARFLSAVQNIPGLEITGSSDLKDRLPGHVSFVLPGVEGEALVMRFDMIGVCLSSGSACHKGMMEPSHVIKALHLDPDKERGALRVSFGKFNSVNECDLVIEALRKIAAQTATA